MIQTIDSVREGENELSFIYRLVSAADELADYTILYRLTDCIELLKPTARDLVGQEVSHTAPDFYYQAHVRYALSDSETAAKTMTLSSMGETAQVGPGRQFPHAGAQPGKPHRLYDWR